MNVPPINHSKPFLFKDITTIQVDFGGVFRHLEVTVQANTIKEVQDLMTRIKNPAEQRFAELATTYDIGGKAADSSKSVTLIQESANEGEVIADKVDGTKETTRFTDISKLLATPGAAGDRISHGQRERLEKVSRVFTEVFKLIPSLPYQQQVQSTQQQIPPEQPVRPLQREPYLQKPPPFRMGLGTTIKIESLELPSQSTPPEKITTQVPVQKKESTHPLFLQLQNYGKNASQNELRIVRKANRYEVVVVPKKDIPKSNFLSYFRKDKYQTQDFTAAVLLVLSNPAILSEGTKQGDSKEFQEIYRAAHDILISIQGSEGSQEDYDQILGEIKDIAEGKATYNVGGKLYLEVFSRKVEVTQQTWKDNIARLPDDPNVSKDQLVTDWTRNWLPEISVGDTIKVKQFPSGQNARVEEVLPIIDELATYLGEANLAVNRTDITPPSQPLDESVEQARIQEMLTKLIEKPAYKGSKLEKLLRLSTQFISVRGLQKLTDVLQLDRTWQVKQDRNSRKFKIQLLPDGGIVLTLSTKFVGTHSEDDRASFGFIAETTVKCHRDSSISVKPEDVTFSVTDLEYDIPKEAEQSLQKYPAYLESALAPFRAV